MKKLIILLLAVLCAAPGYGQSKKKVAVYVTGEADAPTKKVIGAKLVAAITKDDDYAAVERTADFLAELNKEQDYQRSGAVDEYQIAQVGKQFGVAFVCVADLTNVLGSRFVSARLITVQTGVVTATAERDSEIKSMTDLTGLAEDVAAGLINNEPPCHRVDKSAEPYGCCKGLTAIDGICRDMSRGYYWKYHGNCKTVRRYAKVRVDSHNTSCPYGSTYASSIDVACLYDVGFLKLGQNDWVGLWDTLFADDDWISHLDVIYRSGHSQSQQVVPYSEGWVVCVLP